MASIFWICFPAFLIQVCVKVRCNGCKGTLVKSVEELFGTQRHAALRLFSREFKSQVA
jgi:hypothetical protein